jgi:hypothetical protein
MYHFIKMTGYLVKLILAVFREGVNGSPHFVAPTARV